MRPALQRLVARPTARELLRFLVGVEGPARTFAPANIEKGGGRRRGCMRGYAGAAVAVKEDGVEEATSGSRNRTRAATPKAQLSKERRRPKETHAVASTEEDEERAKNRPHDTPNVAVASQYNRRQGKKLEGGHEATLVSVVSKEDRGAAKRRECKTSDVAVSPGNHGVVENKGRPQAATKAVAARGDPGNVTKGEHNSFSPRRVGYMRGRKQLSSYRPLAPRPNSESLALTIFSAEPRVPLKEWSPQWDEFMWTHDELEFESDLDSVRNPGDRERLLDSSEFRHDFDLWALFLGYRKRIHGNAGVLTFWNAIRKRDIRIPTSGPVADSLWQTFLNLGFENSSMLEDIYRYAGRIWQFHRRRWMKLHPQIVQYFLSSNDADRGFQWHNRLKRIYPPGPRGFTELCQMVLLNEGAQATLKHIYTQYKFRSIYSTIVPALCEREDYKTALDWHFFLLKHGDVPASVDVAKPLVQYLVSYDPDNARKVTKGLVDAGVTFATTLSAELEDNTTISREMMNLIHGQTFHVPVKQYNDDLGARWFATNWVSLDVAINAISALGIEEIGPLSLQAIALRDPDPTTIVSRIEQLKVSGISIGKSLYSRAIESFARNNKYELLNGLLHSDQHPDELENSELQESLLTAYAQSKDWSQYRRTLEIRVLRSTSPEVERRNIELRVISSSGDVSAILDSVEDMNVDKIPIKTKTIAQILRCILGPRLPGNHPVRYTLYRGPFNGNRTQKQDDVSISIAMLKSIVRAGTYVCPNLWHEIIRRLGMRRCLDSQRNLCLWLASLYGPAKHTFASRVSWRYHVPAEVPFSHRLHPLKALFPARLQKAIVEWGFITHAPARTSRVEHGAQKPHHHMSRDITFGIKLLKDLNALGVHIDSQAVRKAIFDRLITYYGPGHSRKPYNVLGARRLGSLESVTKQIDEALGGDYFSSVALEEIVQGKAMMRLERLSRRRVKDTVAPSKDPRILRVERRVKELSDGEAGF